MEVHSMSFQFDYRVLFSYNEFLFYFALHTYVCMYVCMCKCMLCVCMCTCARTLRGQLELHTVKSCLTWVLKWNSAPLKSSKLFYTLSHLSSHSWRDGSVIKILLIFLRT